MYFFFALFQLYQQGRLCQLGGEFCELEVFAKVLRASDKRYVRFKEVFTPDIGACKSRLIWKCVHSVLGVLHSAS